MKIDVLSGSTVKITLSGGDMRDYDVKYESLSRKSPDTKRLLGEVLKAVSLESDMFFDANADRLFVEAFPRSDGGCMLYISSLEEEEKSARPIEVGDTVMIRSMGVKATVLSISPDRVLQLQAGIMKVSAREDEVLLLNEQKVTVKVAEKASAALRTVSVSPEIDIRGMLTDEGIPVVERYIDSASLGGLKTVTIIHGKGTGALRAAVQQSLRKNPQVKSFRPGKFGEGEMGVTVVELK